MAATILEHLRAAFRGTPPQVSEQQDFLREAADMGATRVNRYCLREEYYDGLHKTRVMDRAKLFLQASGLPYCENFCETVVDTHATRLRLTGFTVKDDDTASEWLTENWWGRPDMPAVQSTVHNRTLALGDGFLILEWDPLLKMPRACWNHPANIKPVYDPDDADELLYVAKTWKTTRVSPTNPTGLPIRRLNLYYPDRIEKWFAVGEEADAHWHPHLDAEDHDENGPTWPIPWTRSGKLPGPDSDPADALGIPVIHFRRRPLGNDFGRSILTGVIPQQDALNKQLLDLFYVMDTQGWKQRWGSGIPDGTNLRVAVGEWVTSTDSAARFGEFSAEDPGPMGVAIEGTLQRISARSKTPLHDLVKGEPPSGEALKVAEGGLTHSTKDTHIDFGTPWGQTARLAALLQEVYGEGGPKIDPTASVDPVWDNPETRDETAEATRFGTMVRDLGLSKRTALTELGYDPEEEAKHRDEENAAALAHAEAMFTASGGDRVPGGSGPGGKPVGGKAPGNLPNAGGKGAAG